MPVGIGEVVVSSLPARDGLTHFVRHPPRWAKENPDPYVGPHWV